MAAARSSKKADSTRKTARPRSMKTKTTTKQHLLIADQRVVRPQEQMNGWTLKTMMVVISSTNLALSVLQRVARSSRVGGHARRVVPPGARTLVVPSSSRSTLRSWYVSLWETYFARVLTLCALQQQVSNRDLDTLVIDLNDLASVSTISVTLPRPCANPFPFARPAVFCKRLKDVRQRPGAEHHNQQPTIRAALLRSNRQLAPRSDQGSL